MNDIEKLRAENLHLKEQLSNQSEVMELINLATTMIETLEECRNHSLPLNLAKKIDSLLNQAKYL